MIAFIENDILLTPVIYIGSLTKTNKLMTRDDILLYTRPIIIKLYKHLVFRNNSPFMLHNT